ncbi:MAG TPA: SpoIVB peptidase S55 domain-containing protein [Nocardioidaceae bacterium]|nr:SpoIVB peptidase S55 domain-containing protein [Nocardioidaceae bacterium]
MTLHLFHTSDPHPAPRRARSRAAVGVVGAGAVVLAGFASVPAAQSATDPGCPEAYPAAALTAGQPVHGLTVSKGTIPDAFTGEVVGVLDDYIAPDLDVAVVTLKSPALDAAGGIWAGMSGSPVYAADGRLIGAVSYALAYSPTMVTGVTLAADMFELLDSDSVAAQRSLAEAAEADTVALPRALARELVASDAATQEQAAGGLTRLPLPVAVSGRAPRKLRDVETALPTSGTRVYQGAAAPVAGEATTPVPGGNVAVSIAYGDLTYAATGTVTAVCGDEVLAFGHPFLYMGRNTLGMHGGSTLLVQPDPYWGGAYKLMNIGGPVGSVDNEMLTGIHGLVGEMPRATTITSYVEAAGRSRTGTSEIVFQPDMPYLASWHLYLDQDRVLQAWTKGSGAVSWTVQGTREDGSPFTYTRRDRYASQWSISDDTAWVLYGQLSQLRDNPFEKIAINDIRTDSRLSTSYDVYVIKEVAMRKDGVWTALEPDSRLRLRAGATKRLKVSLTSQTLGVNVVKLDVKVPLRAAGRSGSLSVVGGNWWGGDYYEEGMGSMSGASSFDQLLKRMRNAPRNDAVVASLDLYGRGDKSLSRQFRASAGAVTEGSYWFGVRVPRK